MYVYTCILLQYYYLDAIKHKRDFRDVLEYFFSSILLSAAFYLFTIIYLI